MDRPLLGHALVGLSSPAPVLTAQADAELVQALAAGREEALDELVRRHAARVRGYLGYLARDGGWADDLTQEVFLRLHDRAASYDPRWPLEVWLLRIARNLSIDLQRREGARRRRQQAVAAGHPTTACSALDEVERRELGVHLQRALHALAEPFRSVFVLREIEGLSYEEIGAVMRLSAKTVSTRLHRARMKLRTELSNYLRREPTR